MSRSATAWLKDGGIYLGSRITFGEGSGQVTGPFFSVSASNTPEAIWQVVQEALAESKMGDSLDPTPRREVIKPLLKLARLRSWKSFICDAKYVSIFERESGVFRLQPWISNGKGTFGGLPEAEVMITSGEPKALGETLVRAFEQCKVDTNPRNWRYGFFDPD